MAVLGGQVYAQLTVDDSKFVGAMRNADKQLSSFAKGLKTAVIGVAGLQGIRIGTRWARDLIAAGDETQRFKVQLNAALQDGEKAAERLGQAIRFAASTPFRSSDAVAAIRDLTLLDFSNVENSLKGIGNIAMTFGRNMGEITQALYGMETEVFRRLGIDINRMGSQWQITFRGKVYKPIKNDIQSLRQLIVDQIGNIDLAGGIEAGARTISGQWNQFGDRITEIKRRLMDTQKTSEYLTNSLMNVVKAFERWNKSEEGIRTINKLAGQLRGAIDMADKSARILGKTLIFVMKHAALLKDIFVTFAAAKGLAYITKHMSQFGAQAIAAKTALEEARRAATMMGVGSTVISSYKKDLDVFKTFSRETAKYHIGMIQLDEEARNAMLKRAAAMERVRGHAARSIITWKSLGASIRAIPTALGGFAAAALPMLKAAAVVAALTAGFRGLVKVSEHLQIVWGKGMAFKESEDAATRVNKLENELIDITDRQAAANDRMRDATRERYNILYAIKTLHPDNITNLEAEKNVLEEQLALEKMNLKLEQKIAEANEISVLQEIRKSFEGQYDAKLRIKKIDDRILELQEQQKNKAEEKKKALEEEFKAATSIRFMGDVGAQMIEFDQKVRAIAENVRAAQDEARKTAKVYGSSFEEMGKAIEAEGAAKIKDVLDALEKISPALSELAKKRLPNLADLDRTGTVSSLQRNLESAKDTLQEMIGRWNDMSKYYGIPSSKFLPRLREYLKNLKPLSEEWKVVRDAIEEATQAEKDYQDQLAGKTSDILSRLKKAFDEHLLSPGDLKAALESNMPVILGDVARGMSELFKGQNMTDAQKYAVIISELQDRLAGFGLSAVKVKGQLKGFGFEAGTTAKWLEGAGIAKSDAIKAFGRAWDISKKEIESNMSALPHSALSRLLLGPDDGKKLMKDVERLIKAPKEMAGDLAIGDYAKVMREALSGVYGASAEEMGRMKDLAQDMLSGMSGRGYLGDLSSDLKEFETRLHGVAGLSRTEAEGISESFVMALTPLTNQVPEIAEKLRALQETALPTPERVNDAMVNAMPVMTSLTQVLERETVTVQELIRANGILEERMKALESALAKADFRTVKQEVDMDVSISTTQPAEAIKRSLQDVHQNFSTV